MHLCTQGAIWIEVDEKHAHLIQLYMNQIAKIHSNQAE